MKDAGPFRSTLPILGILVVAIIALRLIGGGSAPPPPAFSEKLTLEQASRRANETGRPVLAFASAEWCGPCRDLKRGPLRDEAVSAIIADRTVPAYLDMTATNDPAVMALARQLGIAGLPTLLLLEDSAEVARVVGYRSARDLRTWLERHID